MAEITDITERYIIVNGMVQGRLKTYAVRGGNGFQMFVPDPKGPDEGWAPGQRDKYLRDLHNSSQPKIRAAVKQQFGTTSFRMVADDPYEKPVTELIDHERRMGWTQ